MNILGRIGSAILLRQTDVYLDNMIQQGGVLRIQASFFNGTYLGSILKDRVLVQVAQSQNFFFFCRDELVTALKAKAYADEIFYLVVFPVCVIHDTFAASLIVGEEALEISGLKKVHGLGFLQSSRF